MIGAKGLFGKSMMPGQMQPAYSMPQNMAAQDGANLGMASPQKRGGGFFGQGGAGRAIAGSIGDALLQQSGMAPIYAPQMQFQQAMAARQAEEQRSRAADLADYRTKLGIEAEVKGPQGPDIGLFEDNAGNRFRYDKSTGMPIDEKPVFVDPNERVYFQDGAMVRVPNRFGQGGGSQGSMKRVTNQQDYDALQPGEQYTDPSGNVRTKGGGASNGTGSFRP
jgi:hypothetical protein